MLNFVDALAANCEQFDGDLGALPKADNLFLGHEDFLCTFQRFLTFFQQLTSFAVPTTHPEPNLSVSDARVLDLSIDIVATNLRQFRQQFVNKVKSTHVAWKTFARMRSRAQQSNTSLNTSTTEQKTTDVAASTRVHNSAATARVGASTASGTTPSTWPAHAHATRHQRADGSMPWLEDVLHADHAYGPWVVRTIATPPPTRSSGSANTHAPPAPTHGTPPDGAPVNVRPGNAKDVSVDGGVGVPDTDVLPRLAVYQATMAALQDNRGVVVYAELSRVAEFFSIAHAKDKSRSTYPVLALHLQNLCVL